MSTDGEPLRGPTGETVRTNVKRLREARNLSLRGLAQLTADFGYPLGHSAINQIEKGARRVDVDDLFILAVALDVSPITLLMPRADRPDEQVTVTGLGEFDARSVWDFLIAMHNRITTPPLDDLWDVSNVEWRMRSRPRWDSESPPADLVRQARDEVIKLLARGDTIDGND